MACSAVLSNKYSLRCTCRRSGDFRSNLRKGNRKCEETLGRLEVYLKRRNSFSQFQIIGHSKLEAPRRFHSELLNRT